MLMMVAKVSEETLGQFLAGLRGPEELSKVARRINYRITPTGIKNIEEGVTKRPKDTTLRILAEAYARTPADEPDLYRKLLRLAGYDVMELPGVGPVAGPQTAKEQRVMERYRALDRDAQSAIDVMLDTLERRQPPES